jgi:very-short-patch-repair endonuclease
MEREYTVGKYIVDLFFPDYKLVVECDEHGHTSCDADKDLTRTEMLTEALGASWIRFNPDCSDFNIIDVINQVHTHILITICG